MVQKKIPLIPNQYYHIYNRSIAGNQLFREERNYLFFLERIHKYILPVSNLVAYCLMPNHYHFILKLTTDDLSSAMQKLALSYVMSYNLVYRQSGHLFQGPFQRKHVADLSYLLHLSRYIHLNPVKAALVPQAELWEYSSYQEYIGTRTLEIVDPSAVLDLISEKPRSSLSTKQKEYKKYVEQWEFDYMEFKIKK